MKIVAFSTQTGAASVMKAIGVAPYTFPPYDMSKFRRSWLQGMDVLYFHLHGVKGQGYFYGDNWRTAMSDDQIRECDLSGSIAFVANCYGLGSKMSQALLDAGCSAVVAGPDVNYAYKDGVVRGADLLGQFFISALRRVTAMKSDEMNDPVEALRLAKMGIAMYLKKRNPLWRAFFAGPERDALEFEIVQGAST